MKLGFFFQIIYLVIMVVHVLLQQMLTYVNVHFLDREVIVN